MDTTIKNSFLRRRKLAFLLLFLYGCQSPNHWQVSHQKGSQKEFDSAKISYPVRDKVNGVAVEMIYAKEGLRTYLEVHSQMIPPYQSDLKKALVKIKTSGKTLQGVAHRHQGGQRASLPHDLQQAIVDSLLGGHPVTIELIGYSTTLQPHDFALSYSELRKAPSNIPLYPSFKL